MILHIFSYTYNSIFSIISVLWLKLRPIKAWFHLANKWMVLELLTLNTLSNPRSNWNLTSIIYLWKIKEKYLYQFYKANLFIT